MRAIAKAMECGWDEVYAGIALEGYIMCDMPTANHVWGAYLSRKGFKRRFVSDNCSECYTVADFAAEHSKGTYILAISGHVVCVINGDWYDTWDSGAEIPIYYWQREE